VTTEADSQHRLAGGIHRTRLAASKVHSAFSEGGEAHCPKTGLAGSSGGTAFRRPWSAPCQCRFPYPTPSRSLSVTGEIYDSYSDGADDLPSDATLWSWFLHNAAVAPHLAESLYPTLYGKFPSGTKRGADLPTCHSLLVDRRDRRAYVVEPDQAMILFALMEPEEGDAHNVFVDGMLMSPGNEDYKVPPPPWLVDKFRQFLDRQVQVSQGA